MRNWIVGGLFGLLVTLSIQAQAGSPNPIEAMAFKLKAAEAAQYKDQPVSKAFFQFDCAPDAAYANPGAGKDPAWDINAPTSIYGLQTARAYPPADFVLGTLTLAGGRQDVDCFNAPWLTDGFLLSPRAKQAFEAQGVNGRFFPVTVKTDGGDKPMFLLLAYNNAAADIDFMSSSFFEGDLSNPAGWSATMMRNTDDIEARRKDNKDVMFKQVLLRRPPTAGLFNFGPLFTDWYVTASLAKAINGASLRGITVTPTKKLDLTPPRPPSR